MNNFAALKPECPFFPVFDHGWVPIVNIIHPNVVICEGDGGPQTVYMVDLDKLTQKQFEQVALLVHQQCGPDIPLEIARKEMRARGLPLRAKHVRSVVSDSMFFL